VTTQKGCGWTASGTSWIKVLSGASGTGSGKVTYKVAENDQPSPRSAQASIAGRTLTVNQSAAVASRISISVPAVTSTSYSITASAGAGGSISPSGISTVSAGGTLAYTITPAEGFSIASVQVDGVSIGATSSYTFNNVTKSHTIKASFSSISSSARVARVITTIIR
jgi:hypothetical protein